MTEPFRENWSVRVKFSLYYLFDFGDRWNFQIIKARHKDKAVQPGAIYPRDIESKGKNPEQYQELEECTIRAKSSWSGCAKASSLFNL